MVDGQYLKNQYLLGRGQMYIDYYESGKMLIGNALDNPLPKQNQAKTQKKMSAKKSDKPSQSQHFLGKKDIMQMFDCKDDKALRILKRMCSQNFAFRMNNKEYYTTQEDIKKYFEMYMGKTIHI